MSSTLLTSVPTRSRARASDAPARDFRPDIQGLRAVAVLLVVLYHAAVPGLTGGYVGVDVFFVISGFLITGHLVRELAATGRIRFGQFYLRRARRLLPAAVLVVVVTLVVTRVWAPYRQAFSLTRDSIFVALYSFNYRLAADGVDYQQENGPPSPLQHYWSLSVEEQFYLLLPLLLVVVAFLTRKRWRGGTTAMVAAVVAASFLLSVSLVESNQPYAYFSLQSRAWEFGVGAAIALGSSRLSRMPITATVIVSWVGLAALMASAFVFDDATRFPGTAALLPVLGTGAVIAAGSRPEGAGAESLLGLRFLQGIGKVSYPWYLWHWPFVVLMPYVLGYDVSWWRSLEMMALALWFAMLTHWLLEGPVFRAKLRRRTVFVTAVASTAAVLATAGLVSASLPVLVGTGSSQQVVASVALANDQYRAEVAAVVSSSALTRIAPKDLMPTVADAASDFPESTRGPGNCQAAFLVVDQGSCVYGAQSGSKTAVIFGDSHAEQWEPAFSEAATKADWKLINWTKSACPVGDIPISNPALNREYTECDSWKQKTVQRILDLHPDTVIVSQSDSVIGNAYPDAKYVDETVKVLVKFASAGIKVVFVKDDLRPAVDVPACLADHLSDVQACARTTLSDFFAPRRQALAARLISAGIATLDPQPWLCTKSSCPPIIANMVVYRDESHLTATYSAWLAPLVAGVFR